MSSLESLREIAKQEQEGLTKYKGVINSDHAYVHQGKAFTAVISTGSISAVYRIAFQTPTVASGKFIHWRPVAASTSAAYISIKLTEEETYTGGSAVTPINRNRNIAAVTTMQAFVHNVTASPSGTVLQSLGLGTAGVPANNAGGGASSSQEIVLKPNTIYLVSITPAAATQVELDLFWYEEDGYQG